MGLLQLKLFPANFSPSDVTPDEDNDGFNGKDRGHASDDAGAGDASDDAGGRSDAETVVCGCDDAGDGVTEATFDLRHGIRLMRFRGFDFILFYFLKK
jgi:hypothetical protein